MNKLLIATATSLALFLAGATYAAQHEAPKGDAKPAEETMKQDTMKKDEAKPKAKKTASKKKCAKGEIYSKKEKKCVPKG